MNLLLVHFRVNRNQWEAQIIPARGLELRLPTCILAEKQISRRFFVRQCFECKGAMVSVDIMLFCH